MARAIVVKKANRKATGKRVASPVDEASPKARKPGKPTKRTGAQVVATTLPAAMTGRASPAKAKEGNEPVFAYIRSLPQPQAALPNASMPWRPGRCRP